MNLSEILSYPFMRNALIVILFGGISFPMIGVFILYLNLIPLRFAMMHVALLGGAVGLFLKIDPLLFGLLFCIVSSMALGPLSDKMKLGVGILSGYFMTLTLALAFILIYKADIHVLEAFNILWGNIFSLSIMDLIIVGLISLIVLTMVFLFFKEIQAILYDREIAIAIGLPEKAFYYLIIFILGLTVAVLMRMIGALLIDAFVLLPAMAATLISRSLKQTFFFSALFGLVSGIAGLILSFFLDIPTSSMIILVASILIAGCFVLRRWLFGYEKI
jgi:ABC-type Mn2+/Zn2+ transport system permease subunit